VPLTETRLTRGGGSSMKSSTGLRRVRIEMCEWECQVGNLIQGTVNLELVQGLPEDGIRLCIHVESCLLSPLEPL